MKAKITDTIKNLTQLIEALDASLANEKLSLTYRAGIKHAKNLVLICLMEECLEAGISHEIEI